MLKAVTPDTVHTQAFLNNIFFKINKKIKIHAVVLGCCA